MASRLTINRRHSFSGKKNLDWFFANRKWIRTSALAVTECAWAKRPLPTGEAGVRILLLAAKRSYKLAHDRNKIRRWLRAAITSTEEFSRLEETMLAHGEQLLMMMRISKPIADVKWNVVLEDVTRIAEHQKKREAKSV
ncbi:MAG TPA: ribonuclease P protein component [Candidatus Kapabacteria bacterium]|nr:ribonuclease P protein component [Candidatus Kapabacteria bacterium]